MTRRVVCVGAAALVLAVLAWSASSAWAFGWSVQASPSPPQAKNGSLSGGVSCTSPTACMAVGVYTSRASIQVPLAERWNGVSWSIQAVPNPAGSDGGGLGGVSCASPDACTAVGSYDEQQGPRTIGGPQVPLAEHWDGNSWSIQPVPSPVGAASVNLTAVSCASPTVCTAVGGFNREAGPQETLVEHWDGVAWSIQPIPDPAAATWGALSGVSCPSATDCTAVGPGETLVEHWDGVAWSIEATPASGLLSAVSCSSPTACTAVGDQCSCSQDRPVVEHWDGTAWSVEPTPEVPASDVRLFDVSCASSTDCTAVGFADSGDPAPWRTLVEHWDGTGWSIQPTPGAAGATPRLWGVSCASTSDCTAVGDYTGPLALWVTLAQRWNNGAWSIETTPNPSGPTQSQLTGVSCASSTACVAVGTATNASSLAERWNGSKWSVVPVAASAWGGEPAALSCVSPTACTVVAGEQAERWNGRRWTVHQLPQLDLDAVSCTSETACTAVAAFSCDACGPPSRVPLVARWNGLTWSIQQLLGRTVPDGLSGISCTSARACTAVGRGTVERWNGRKWWTQPTPGDSWLQAVACTSTTACTAVGTLSNSAYLAERWNGHRWSIQRTPDVPGAAQGSLTGISCTSQTACTAVGSYQNRSFQQHGLVERWSGRRWSIQPTPVPAGATSSNLTSVSCSLATACTAVGSYTNSAGDELTLVERWNGNQ